MIQIPKYFPYYTFFNASLNYSFTLIINNKLLHFQLQVANTYDWRPPLDHYYFINKYAQIIEKSDNQLASLAKSVINIDHLNATYNQLSHIPPLKIVTGADFTGDIVAKVLVIDSSNNELCLKLDCDNFYQVGKDNPILIEMSPRYAFLSFLHQQLNPIADTMWYLMILENNDFENVQAMVQSRLPLNQPFSSDKYDLFELLIEECKLILDGIISIDELVATGGVTILKVIKEFDFVRNYLLDIVNIDMTSLTSIQKAVVVNIYEIAKCSYPHELKKLADHFRNSLITYQQELIPLRGKYGERDCRIIWEGN